MNLIIIGGVAGGATAAARARRLDENARIVLFERGEYISFANCGLPYYIGGTIKRRNDLFVTDPDSFRKRYRIDLRTFSEVTAIDRARRVVAVRETTTGREYEEPYDRIILAPGAEPVRPPIPGADGPGIFTLRNVPDTDRIKELVDRERPASAVIVGGGFIGLEMAENLARLGIRVTVVEMLDQVLAPLDYEMAAMVHGHLRDKGVGLLLGIGVKAIEVEGGRTRVRLSDGATLGTDMVVMSVGVRPENKLASEAGLEIGPRGHIVVDAAMRTSDPDVFAVGDAVQIRDLVTGRPTALALAGPANKQARIAADNALGRRSLYQGAQGTAIVKIFDLVASVTGAAEKTLRGMGLPHLVSYTASESHATYYPGARNMFIKLVFSPADGRLFGAQVVGQDGVDKRIDVLATAVRAGLTVFDLEELELAYAPPYSSAKDPANIAGFVASNMLRGDIDTVNWNDLDALDAENTVFLDLRTAPELRLLGSIPGAVHIPLNDLRDRLDELDRDKTYVAYCAVGQRAYVAYRILIQHGFKARNLSGGYDLWRGVHPKTE